MDFEFESITKKRQSILLCLWFEKTQEWLDIKIHIIEYRSWMDRNCRLEVEVEDGKWEKYDSVGQYWRWESDRIREIDLRDYINDENLIEKQFEIY